MHIWATTTPHSSDISFTETFTVGISTPPLVDVELLTKFEAFWFSWTIGCRNSVLRLRTM
eukprot:TRINITY_DN2569_c3_g1_i1.p2 TRINITY_DN2569_c3_g1~~TRINITY_DN2569_c3_g1_i1.p2  ORF type:complete len:60 (+),score=8.17 TRINITY_DN2569_c3_g1_i1:139-318(+)